MPTVCVVTSSSVLSVSDRCLPATESAAVAFVLPGAEQRSLNLLLQQRQSLLRWTLPIVWSLNIYFFLRAEIEVISIPTWRLYP